MSNSLYLSLTKDMSGDDDEDPWENGRMRSWTFRFETYFEAIRMLAYT
jgi:hypothetical protein